jgi:hypothetical protein
MNIFYIIGGVVVIIFVAGFLECTSKPILNGLLLCGTASFGGRIGEWAASSYCGTTAMYRRDPFEDGLWSIMLKNSVFAGAGASPLDEMAK